jgi:2-polyprenyl-3-methyl-5-hydroxy-6-metoxy-1,4-benzoquinol methylase
MSERLGLSVVLIVRDEASRIRRCLDSVTWADELIVVDGQSADGTPAICREYGARVLSREMRHGFGEQKGFAVAQATRPWVLSVDADEVVSPALRRAIEAAIAAPGPWVGFRMPRRTAYLGRFIRHAGWYPAPVLRLFRRGHGRFTDALVHERLVVDGPVGDLGEDLLHFSYESLGDHVRKLLLYTAYDARMLRRRGVRLGRLTAPWYLALKPALVFGRKYVAQGGWREGWHGVVLCAMAALVVFVNYVRLGELTGWLDPGPAGGDEGAAALPGTYEAVAALLADLPPGRLLDAPAGLGVLSERLSRAGHRVVAADRAPPKPVGGRPSVVLDLERPLPFRDGAFDAAVCVEGIEHLESPYAPVRELRRVLRAGGLLVVSTPNVLNLRSRLKFLLRGTLFWFDVAGYRRGQHVNPIPVHELRHVLAEAGFVVESVRVNRRPAGLRLAAAIAGPLLRWRARRRGAGEHLNDADLLAGEVVIVRARTTGVA